MTVPAFIFGERSGWKKSGKLIFPHNKEMRILLIAPPFMRLMDYYNKDFPLGLASLAAVIRDKGHEVLIHDSDCNVDPKKMDLGRLEDNLPIYLKSLKDDSLPVWGEIKEQINSFKPDIVGITVFTTFAASSFTVAAIVKSIDINLPVVMGGPHITLRYDEVLKICPDVDYLVRGEGEYAFLELIEKIQSKEKPIELEGIKGISYRLNEKVIHNPKGGFIKDLDTVPFPARDLLINSKFYNSEDMGFLMASRGCPYDCSFCATSVWERKTRFRSVDNIIEEIKHVSEKYNTTQFSFKDDSFTVNNKNVRKFSERLINEKIIINWDCHTRVDLLDEKLLRLMKASGCNKVKVGIETGSERILELMTKRITLDQCRKAAKLFRKVGMYWTGYFMIGIPGETKEDIYKTLDFINELKPDFASLGVYEPYPGTKLFDIGLEKGLVQSERTLEEFYNILPINYYIKDTNRRIDTMSNEEFNELRIEVQNAVHKYNRGFARLARKGISRFKIYKSEPTMLFVDLKKLYSWMR